MSPYVVSRSGSTHTSGRRSALGPALAKAFHASRKAGTALSANARGAAGTQQDSTPSKRAQIDAASSGSLSIEGPEPYGLSGSQAAFGGHSSPHTPSADYAPDIEKLAERQATRLAKAQGVSGGADVFARLSSPHLRAKHDCATASHGHATSAEPQARITDPRRSSGAPRTPERASTPRNSASLPLRRLGLIDSVPEPLGTSYTRPDSVTQNAGAESAQPSRPASRSYGTRTSPSLVAQAYTLQPRRSGTAECLSIDASSRLSTGDSASTASTALPSGRDASRLGIPQPQSGTAQVSPVHPHPRSPAAATSQRGETSSRRSLADVVPTTTTTSSCAAEHLSPHQTQSTRLTSSPRASSGGNSATHLLVAEQRGHHTSLNSVAQSKHVPSQSISPRHHCNEAPAADTAPAQAAPGSAPVDRHAAPSAQGIARTRGQNSCGDVLQPLVFDADGGLQRV